MQPGTKPAGRILSKQPIRKKHYFFNVSTYYHKLCLEFQRKDSKFQKSELNLQEEILLNAGENIARENYYFPSTIHIYQTCLEFDRQGIPREGRQVPAQRTKPAGRSI